MTLRVQLVAERAWCRGEKQDISKLAFLKTHSFRDYRVYTWWHTWYTHDNVSGWTWSDVGVFAKATHMKPPVYLLFSVCEHGIHIFDTRHATLPSLWGNIARRQLCNTFVSRHKNCAKNTASMTGPSRHWTNDNPSEMNRCCFLILHWTLALAIYTSVALLLMLWHRNTHITHKRTYELSWTEWGSNSLPSN